MWAEGTTQPFYSFIMYNNISLYGGFDGTETNRNERNFYKNPTILSCNISSTDPNGIDPTIYYHQCSMILISAMNNIIDGFIFKDSRFTSEDTDGRRRLTTQKRRRLENEYSYDGVHQVLSDTSDGRGGGINSNGTNVKIVNCLFTNIVATKGGGIYCMGNYYEPDSYNFSPTIINAIFIGNGAERGGGFGGDAYCNFKCNYCKFLNNYSGEKGGSIYLDYIWWLYQNYLHHYYYQILVQLC